MKKTFQERARQNKLLVTILMIICLSISAALSVIIVDLVVSPYFNNLSPEKSSFLKTILLLLSIINIGLATAIMALWKQNNPDLLIHNMGLKTKEIYKSLIEEDIEAEKQIAKDLSDPLIKEGKVKK